MDQGVKTTTIRISRATHDKLRKRAYLTNNRISAIIDDLVKDFEQPSVSDKINSLIKYIK